MGKRIMRRAVAVALFASMPAGQQALAADWPTRPVKFILTLGPGSGADIGARLIAERLTQHLGGAKIYFKRDELNHTGSHKINNCMGQILLARRMGKKRIIAETGAGQHGVASATVSALFDLPCVVYMGATDIEIGRAHV